MDSKAQIIATIGPASSSREIIKSMIEHNADVIRLNFSWGNHEEREEQIKLIRDISAELEKKTLILQDLSGPRIQKDSGHSYDGSLNSPLTPKDLLDLKFGVEQKVDYIALSYVGSANDVLYLKEQIKKLGSNIPVIAKIERKSALDALDEIIEVSDAIMIARGDLGNEVPIEQIPFIEKTIIAHCKQAGKPVITATQMLLSMVNNKIPTRAEVSDVAFAIISGSDAVMLSEETAQGLYPVEAVEIMEKIVIEAEKHLDGLFKFNVLS